MQKKPSFDGIKVLPSSLIEQYKSLISKKMYIDADNLLVTLSERKLFYYYRNNFVNKMNIKIGKDIFVAEDDYVKYDNCLGLRTVNGNICAII